MPRPPLPPEQETIAGLASPPGRSGVAVVRLSGPGLPHLPLPLLVHPDGKPVAAADLAPRLMKRLDLLDGVGGALLDQALVVFFPAPHSFTGEPMLEIHCHGAPVVVARLLGLLAELGIRPSAPGEFSRRAFFNGKLDLTRAEGLMALIHAATLRGARQAARQMDGELHRRIVAAREGLLTVLAHLEASLDFSDAEIEPDDLDHLNDRITAIAGDLTALLDGSRLGTLLQEGFELAIVGRPNVGKSSLFNRLCGERKAIVTAIPGTTRDVLEHHLEIEGVPVRLLDTAGLRDSDEAVEQEGIRRAEARLRAADGVLLVLEMPLGVTAADRAIVEQADPQRLIVVWNKSDLLPAAAPPPPFPGLDAPAVTLSCRSGAGLERLRKTVAGLFAAQPDGEAEEGLAILAARQRLGLQQAVDHLAECAALVAADRPGEIVAIPLNQALTALGELVGAVTHDQLLDRIFASFCIGK